MEPIMTTDQRKHRGTAGLTASLKVPLALAAFLLSSNCGCYDGDSLVTQARSAALSTHLAEVDLGSYHTSLPRDPKTGSVTQLRLHIFGNVPHYRVADCAIRHTCEAPGTNNSSGFDGGCALECAPWHECQGP